MGRYEESESGQRFPWSQHGQRFTDVLKVKLVVPSDKNTVPIISATRPAQTKDCFVDSHFALQRDFLRFIPKRQPRGRAGIPSVYRVNGRWSVRTIIQHMVAYSEAKTEPHKILLEDGRVWTLPQIENLYRLSNCRLSYFLNGGSVNIFPVLDNRQGIALLETCRCKGSVFLNINPDTYSGQNSYSDGTLIFLPNNVLQWKEK